MPEYVNRSIRTLAQLVVSGALTVFVDKLAGGLDPQTATLVLAGWQVLVTLAHNLLEAKTSFPRLLKKTRPIVGVYTVTGASTGVSTTSAWGSSNLHISRPPDVMPKATKPVKKAAAKKAPAKKAAKAAEVITNEPVTTRPDPIITEKRPKTGPRSKAAKKARDAAEKAKDAGQISLVEVLLVVLVVLVVLIAVGYFPR